MASPPRINRKRVLVTGASGFIGQHLVPALAQRGFRLSTLGRRQVASFGPAIEQITIHDLSQELDWQPIVERADVVIHLAAIAHQGSRVPRDKYESVNWRATAALAKATARTGAKLIFLSSVAAQSPSANNTVLTEQDPCRPQTAYGLSKLNAENDIAQAGGRYVILRPPLVYGSRIKGNMRRLLQLAKLPIPLPLGAVNNRRSLLAVENLIWAIVLLIDRDDISNDVFLISDDTPLSLSEMISYLRTGMGKSPNLIPVPSEWVSIFFRLIGMSQEWERLAGSLVISNNRLKGIGYSPVIDTPEGLVEMARRERDAKLHS